MDAREDELFFAIHVLISTILVCYLLINVDYIVQMD